MDFREISVKSILTSYGISGIDYVINPYIGCGFGCTYCYASAVGQFIGKSTNDWGAYVYAKVNAPDLLKTEIKTKLKNKGLGKGIFLSLMTDCYQGVEAKCKITRKCLEVLADFGFEGTLSILTKSDLVLRDIDIFKKIKHVAVGLTITSSDNKISRSFDKFAPNISDRLKALRILNENQIKTFVFIGPILPYFTDNREELEKIFVKIKELGTQDVFVEHLDFSPYIRNRLFVSMGKFATPVKEKFYDSQSNNYRNKLADIVRGLANIHKINAFCLRPSFMNNFKAQNI